VLDKKFASVVNGPHRRPLGFHGFSTTHATFSVSALTVLARWANALGYRVTLEKIDPLA
jgi:hypothetical protein